MIIFDYCDIVKKVLHEKQIKKKLLILTYSKQRIYYVRYCCKRESRSRNAQMFGQIVGQPGGDYVAGPAHAKVSHVYAPKLRMLKIVYPLDS